MPEELHTHCYYSDLPSPMAYMQEVEKTKKEKSLSAEETDRVIEMAWEDRTSFEAIKSQFGLNEADVKALMKRELKSGSYIRWRRRVENCKTKHAAKRVNGISRFKSALQRTITLNKISKRRNK